MIWWRVGWILEHHVSLVPERDLRPLGTRTCGRSARVAAGDGVAVHGEPPAPVPERLGMVSRSTPRCRWRSGRCVPPAATSPTARDSSLPGKMYLANQGIGGRAVAAADRMQAPRRRLETPCHGIEERTVVPTPTCRTCRPRRCGRSAIQHAIVEQFERHAVLQPLGHNRARASASCSVDKVMPVTRAMIARQGQRHPPPAARVQHRGPAGRGVTSSRCAAPSGLLSVSSPRGK